MSNNTQAIEPNPNWTSNNCSDFSGTQPISSTVRICGHQANSSALLSSCCGTEQIRFSRCWAYCAVPRDTFEDFLTCAEFANNATRPNATLNYREFFCQSSLRSSSELYVRTSAGVHATRPPRTGWLALLAVVLGLSLVLQPVSAACTFSQTRNFTTLGQTFQTGHYEVGCGSSSKFCAAVVNVVAPPVERSFGRMNAAQPRYDAFFDAVSNATGGRQFPARSEINLTYEYAVNTGNGWYPNWTPILWCVEGLASGCGEIIGSSELSQRLNACAPDFVASNVIKGNLGYVVVD